MPGEGITITIHNLSTPPIHATADQNFVSLESSVASADLQSSNDCPLSSDIMVMEDPNYGNYISNELVGGIPTPLKNMKVSWDDVIPNMEK